MNKEKLRNCQKVKLFLLEFFFRSNFFPWLACLCTIKNFETPKSRIFFLQIIFWFIWNQMCYRDGRPLILKLIPNNEQWYDKIAWFNWNRQRKFSLKCNVAIFKTEFYVKLQKISIWAWAVILGKDCVLKWNEL